jgi:hypothetical protein
VSQSVGCSSARESDIDPIHRSSQSAGECKREWRGLVWASERKLDECEGAWDGSRGGIGEATVSRASGDGDVVRWMSAAGGGGLEKDTTAATMKFG